MFNHSTYSTEEVTMNPNGGMVYPQICAACYQAIAQEPNRRSSPRSYAALAEDTHTYRILDWNGLGTATCRCCGSRQYSERWTVEPRRKAR